MKNLMLDLETLDTENTAVFPSFAAIPFDIETGEMGEPFYQKINIQSAIDAGLTISGATLEWWMSQNRDTRIKMFEGALPLEVVLDLFKQYLMGIELAYGVGFKIWGNSASFDCGILRNGYKATKQYVPWSHREERCYRSFVGEFPEIGKDTINTEHHDPIADCHYQIRRLCTVWKHIHHFESKYRDTQFMEDYETSLVFLSEIVGKTTPDQFKSIIAEARDFLNGTKFIYPKINVTQLLNTIAKYVELPVEKILPLANEIVNLYAKTKEK